MASGSGRRDVTQLPHHQQQEFCTTRSTYRQGRKLTAVKVYTVNDESQHLIVTGVPALGLQDELRRLCTRYGDIKSLVFVPNYSGEDFTETYHVNFNRIQGSRFAKRQMDGKSFFGGVLHVCYAPEMETVPETRAKLVQRRREVRNRCIPKESKPLSKHVKQHSTRAQHELSDTSMAPCVWQGVPLSVDPRTIQPAKELEKASASIYGPQLPGSIWLERGLRGSTLQSRCHKHSEPNQQPDNEKRKRTHVLQDTSQQSIKELASSSSNKSLTPNLVPSQILRFVPSQVKGVQKRIIFRENYGITKPQLPNTSNVSLDASIQAVRAQIRAVSVPNVKIFFERQQCDKLEEL